MTVVSPVKEAMEHTHVVYENNKGSCVKMSVHTDRRTTTSWSDMIILWEHKWREGKQHHCPNAFISCCLGEFFVVGVDCYLELRIQINKWPNITLSYTHRGMDDTEPDRCNKQTFGGGDKTQEIRRVTLDNKRSAFPLRVAEKLSSSLRSWLQNKKKTALIWEQEDRFKRNTRKWIQKQKVTKI